MDGCLLYGSVRVCTFVQITVCLCVWLSVRFEMIARPMGVSVFIRHTTWFPVAAAVVGFIFSFFLFFRWFHLYFLLMFVFVATASYSSIFNMAILWYWAALSLQLELFAVKIASDFVCHDFELFWYSSFESNKENITNHYTNEVQTDSRVTLLSSLDPFFLFDIFLLRL